MAVHYKNTRTWPPAAGHGNLDNLDHDPTTCRWCQLGIPSNCYPKFTYGPPTTTVGTNGFPYRGDGGIFVGGAWAFADTSVGQ